jgi:circadian clock protein KaiC
VRTTIGVEGIDALIEGGVPRGSAVLASGEAGTGKSVLCIQFILAGIREGEPGVYATADHPNRVIEAAASLGWDLRGAVEDGFARVVQIASEESLASPGAAVPGGQAAAMTIGAAASEVDAERVVIDPPLLAGSPDSGAAGEFVASLVRSTLRETHCTTLVSGLRVRGASGFTRLGIEEQLADGIIDLRIDENEGRRTRVLAVRSMHGTRTNLDDHLFAILAGRGMVVGEA